jgi:hypothetical protein
MRGSSARFALFFYVIIVYFFGKFGSRPLKDHHFGSIPLLSHLHVGPHESITCGVHGIYLKFGSFNGIDPIVPYFFLKHLLTNAFRQTDSIGKCKAAALISSDSQ